MFFFLFNVEFRRPGLGKQLPTVFNWRQPQPRPYLGKDTDTGKGRLFQCRQHKNCRSTEHESYLLNANDIKKLTKPYQHDDVVNLAIEKFGSKAQLDAAIAKRDDERERKKNKNILKEQTAQKNRLLAEETHRKRLKLHGEEQKQNGKILKDENLTWLIHTTTGQQCVDKLVASGAPEDATRSTMRP